MKKISFISFFLFGLFSVVLAQKKVFPFKKLLANIDTLIYWGTPKRNMNVRHDTFFAADIKQLIELSFLNKKVKIEEYGVTPSGSISFHKNGKRIALIGCWDINETEYGVNISINEKFAYYGLVILKSELDKFFKKNH